MTDYAFIFIGLVLAGIGAAWLPRGEVLHGFIDLLLGAFFATAGIYKAVESTKRT